MPERMGRFDAVRLLQEGVTLEYSVGGTAVTEAITARVATTAKGRVRRSRRISRLPHPTRRCSSCLAAAPPTPRSRCRRIRREGMASRWRSIRPTAARSASHRASQRLRKAEPRIACCGRVMWVARVPPHRRPLDFTVLVSNRSSKSTAAGAAAAALARTHRPSLGPRGHHAHHTVSSKAAFVVDDVALPVDNPWRRNVRPGDIQFLTDGTGGRRHARRRRLARARPGRARRRRSLAPLHLGAARAADRGDPRRRRSTSSIATASGACATRMATARRTSTSSSRTPSRRPPTCASFPARSAPRRMASSSSPKADRKPTTIGKHNGSVLRISADGRQATVLGYGFRQPNLERQPAHRPGHSPAISRATTSRARRCTSSATGSSTASSATSCRAKSIRRRSPSR